MAISTDIGNYAAHEVIITVGAKDITGYADGTFVKISQDNESSTVVEGADGSIARSIHATTLHTVEITLHKTASDNLYLSGLHTADVVSGARGMFPISIRDLRGESVFVSSKAFIQKKPDLEFGKEAGTTTWTIKAVADPTSFIVGGNE